MTILLLVLNVSFGDNFHDLTRNMQTKFLYLKRIVKTRQKTHEKPDKVLVMVAEIKLITTTIKNNLSI